MLKVQKIENCGIAMDDLRDYPAISQLNVYAFLDSYTIHCVYLIKTECDRNLVKCAIQPHRFDANGQQMTSRTTCKIPQDGLYEITQCVLPDQHYTNWAIKNNMITSEHYFFTDGSGYYKVVNGEILSATITEIITSALEGTSNMYVCFYKLLSTCELSEVYVKMLDSNEVDIRNILQMALDGIRYCLSKKMYWEALRLLNSVRNCGILSDYFKRYAPTKKKGCCCKK